MSTATCRERFILKAEPGWGGPGRAGQGGGPRGWRATSQSWASCHRTRAPRVAEAQPEGVRGM